MKLWWAILLVLFCGCGSGIKPKGEPPPFPPTHGTPANQHNGTTEPLGGGVR